MSASYYLQTHSRLPSGGKKRLQLLHSIPHIHVDLSSPPVGYLLCHGSLNTNLSSQELWKMALRSGLYLTIIRDETINIHKITEDYFDGLKGYDIYTLSSE